MKRSILILVAAALSPMLWAQPSIDPGGILNVSGAVPKLTPNAVFVAYGQNLGPATLVLAPAPNYPGTLAGSSVSFTPVVGGAAIAAKMVFALVNAVAGVELQHCHGERDRFGNGPGNHQ